MEESYTSPIYKVATTSRAQLLFSSEFFSFYTNRFPFLIAIRTTSSTQNRNVYVDP